MNVHDESNIITRYLKKIINKKIIFSGNIQNQMCLYLQLKYVKVHIQQYHHSMLFEIFNKDNICFRSLPKKKFIFNSNVLIYFWVKNKTESTFQLTYLLSILNIKSEIFIIGNNKSGINSIKNILKHWVNIKKLDYQKKCVLYYGRIIKNPTFILKNYFKKYIWNNIIIKTLPGNFDYKGIDTGSILLISTFNKNITGTVLDIGSGSGILSISLKKITCKTQVTLVDNSSTALLCSKLNLHNNNVKGNIFASNIYSNINEKFNLIISNPPTHIDIKKNLNIIKKIIYGSIKHLKQFGELRMVVHSHISCKKEFHDVFKNCVIIKQYNHFSVYQGILK